jgi:hypothetical protein
MRHLMAFALIDWAAGLRTYGTNSFHLPLRGSSGLSPDSLLKPFFRMITALVEQSVTQRNMITNLRIRTNFSTAMRITTIQLAPIQREYGLALSNR